VEDPINVVSSAPHAPHALLVGMSSGVVRLCDLRCNLRLHAEKNSVVVGAGRKRMCDGLYREVTSATLGCDLSLCGNYIAQRDACCMHLFDVRRGASPQSYSVASGGSAAAMAEAAGKSLVNRWVLQDQVARHLGQLYHLRSLFEKVSVRFVGRNRLVTGGFGECVLSANAIDVEETPDVVRIFGTEPAVVPVAEWEASAGAEGEAPPMTTSDEDVARLHREARHTKGLQQQSSTRLSFLSAAMRRFVGGDDSTLRCVTVDASQEYQHQQPHHDLQEWRRVTKLCVIPSTSWVTNSGVGEVLAACSDSVHHVTMPL
jgi:hypothetical protein